jgi:hypothetical protein
VSIECGECERDIRGPHAENCPRVSRQIPSGFSYSEPETLAHLKGPGWSAAYLDKVRAEAKAEGAAEAREKLFDDLIASLTCQDEISA